MLKKAPKPQNFNDFINKESLPKVGCSVIDIIVVFDREVLVVMDGLSW